jgi:hypothetical protein
MDAHSLKAEFGSEALIHRLWLSHLECHGTQVTATITPRGTEAESLLEAWQVVQSLASWLLRDAATLPENERYEIVVGWSSSVGTPQGQIFKTGGLVGDLQRIVSSPTYNDFAPSALRSNWQKQAHRS